MTDTDPSNQLDLVFSALSDPTRRQILGLLIEQDMMVTRIAEDIGRSVALTSKDVSVLASCGLVSRLTDGRARWCRLEPGAVRPAAVWLESFGQFDQDQLDQVEWLLELEGKIPAGTE